MSRLFFSDNLPTFLIKSYPLEADMFDGDQPASPVPSLYSDDPDSTLGSPVRSVQVIKHHNIL